MEFNLTDASIRFREEFGDSAKLTLRFDATGAVIISGVVPAPECWHRISFIVTSFDYLSCKFDVMQYRFEQMLKDLKEFKEE